MGPAGSVWSFYRDYTFNGDGDQILQPDSRKAREIADYLRQNPSARVAIDGPNERYIRSVRDALMDAGVPRSKIAFGAYGDPQRRGDHRVLVMVSN
jgi:outer membrane protein OmpA-like peptidoglycan-associated protein